MATNVSIRESCLHGAMPPCRRACPFQLDIPAFLKKLHAGQLDRAYRQLAESLVFPEIAASVCGGCRESCAKGLSLRALEAFCTRGAADKTPRRYGRLPRRTQSVAVIGAGGAGLACALRLGEKKYQVSVFESAVRWGGRLHDRLAPELVEECLNRSFQGVEWELHLGERIEETAFRDLREHYDAVCVATGNGGDAFGCLESYRSADGGCRLPGVFLCGELVGGNAAAAIAAGVSLAVRIEEYLKIGGPDARNTRGQPERNAALAHGVSAGLAAPISAQEAADESGKCTGCDCDACQKGCALMRRYHVLPPKIESDGLMNEYTQKGLEPSVRKRMLLSCAQCGRCAETCPQKLDIGAFLLERKRSLFRDGSFPPAFHEFYKREMEACSGENALILPVAKAEYLFFPGCQLASSEPELTRRLYALLREKEPRTGLVLSCCGVPAEWAGDEPARDEALALLRGAWEQMSRPVILTACPTCQRMLGSYLPEARVRPVYALLLSCAIPTGRGDGKRWRIFDPCAARAFPELRGDVRRLAAAMQVDTVSAPDGTAECCGMGGHIYATDPGMVDMMVGEALSHGDEPYLTYCMNCRNVFSHAGKECRHILELLTGMASRVAPVHIRELELNRAWLRRTMLADYGLRESGETPESTLPLRTGERLLLELDRALISAGDCEAVVSASERARRFIQHGDGTRSARGQIGCVTLWARYRPGETDAELLDAYSHRIEILGLEEGVCSGEIAGEALICGSCRGAMELGSVKLRYMGNVMSTKAPVCQTCRQVFISREIAEGKMKQVEMMLEDK